MAASKIHVEVKEIRIMVTDMTRRVLAFLFLSLCMTGVAAAQTYAPDTTLPPAEIVPLMDEAAVATTTFALEELPETVRAVGALTYPDFIACT